MAPVLDQVLVLVDVALEEPVPVAVNHLVAQLDAVEGGELEEGAVHEGHAQLIS